MDDDESEEAFFKEFEQIFGFGMGFDEFEEDFEAFTEMLETDTKFMKKMFGGLGKGYRMGGGGKRRK